MKPVQSFDGYYDETGHWVKTKHCFVPCRSGCTCRPPGGMWYNENYDKRRNDVKFDNDKFYNCPGCGIAHSGKMINEADYRDCPECKQFELSEFTERKPKWGVPKEGKENG